MSGAVANLVRNGVDDGEAMNKITEGNYFNTNTDVGGKEEYGDMNMVCQCVFRERNSMVLDTAMTEDTSMKESSLNVLLNIWHKKTQKNY